MDRRRGLAGGYEELGAWLGGSNVWKGAVLVWLGRDVMLKCYVVDGERGRRGVFVLVVLVRSGLVVMEFQGWVR